MTIWKSDFSDKIKWDFFQAVAVSVQLYGCTTWILIKLLEKKLDGNYTRMLCVLNTTPKNSSYVILSSTASQRHKNKDAGRLL